MIDIHCHILPATDDGPATWNMSLEMCQRAVADGITHLVATPHHNERYQFRRRSSQAKLDELASRFRDLKFTLGCEVTISDWSLDQIVRCPEQFTIGTTTNMLVEANETYMPKKLEDALGELISCGVTPIVAHPERHPTLRRRMDVMENLIAMGCLAAATGSALSGFWGSEIRTSAETMLRRGLVQFLVSDGHNTEGRPIILADAKRTATKIVGREQAHELVWDNPSSVILGLPVSS